MTNRNVGHRSIGHRSSRTLYAGIGIALGIVLFLTVNILARSHLRTFKWDLTDNQLYTLSESTYSVLRDIDEPLTVRLFFSKIIAEKAPGIKTYHERVSAMLEQYADLSDGKIKLEYYDPEPFSQVEDQAVAFGLQGIPASDAGDMVYFGLAATNSTDDLEIIPFVNEQREEFLEYDLTRIVHGLANPDKPVAGILTTVPLLGSGQGQPPFAVMSQVLEFFRTRHLGFDDVVIPDEVDVLLVVHPHGLKPLMMYAIDQFILRGGRALVFVDPHAEIDMMQQPPAPMAGISDFNKLLNRWGVNLAEDTVIGDLDAARRVAFQANGQNVSADYIGWLGLGVENFDKGDAIMGELAMINVATAGTLEKLGGENLPDVTPLIATGPRSMRLPAESFGREPNVLKLFRDFQPSGESQVLSVRINGNVATAFPDGKPEGSAYTESHLSVSLVPTNIIVVADVDMLQDYLWINRQNVMGQAVDVPLANNGDFVLNALENLSGSPALMSLRGRASASRPFTMVEDIRQVAEQQFRTKEEELRSKLNEIQGKIVELLSRTNATGDVVISDEDQIAIDDFKSEMLAIRKELRAVQHELRKDIDSLEAQLKFFNIGAVPLFVGALALLLLFQRRRKHKHAGGMS